MQLRYWPISNDQVQIKRMKNLVGKAFTALVIFCALVITLLAIVFKIKNFLPELKAPEIKNPELYIKNSEGKINTIKQDCEKKIIWANKNKDKTKFSLVYIPGFSATRKEIFPVMETLAKDLGLNLFLSRFPYHGENNPEAYKNLTAQDLFDTAVEAYEIGKELGDEVIMIGTSTGAVMISQLSVWQKEIKAMVLISPAFNIMPWATETLASPLGNIINKLANDEYRTWEPKNPDIKKYWDTKYHRDAIPELMRAIYYVDSHNFVQIKNPTLMIYTKEDKIISLEEVEKKFAEIGSPRKKLILMPSPSHVLAGEFTSPQTTQLVIGEIKEWLEYQGVK